MTQLIYLWILAAWFIANMAMITVLAIGHFRLRKKQKALDLYLKNIQT